MTGEWRKSSYTNPQRQLCGDRALTYHEMAAAHPGADQALLAQYRERPLGGALRDAVVLGERLHRRDARRERTSPPKVVRTATTGEQAA